MEKRISFPAVVTGVVLLLASLAWAAPTPTKTVAQSVPPFPGTLVNARYVYVTSYDGDQFNINLFPEDRQAIGAVQDYLWRMMGRGGLQKAEAPLVTDLEKAFDLATAK
ncbi:MAG: hypothetical protein ABSH02_18025 [Candidatus Sulfotelmatobacter sp.]